MRYLLRDRDKIYGDNFQHRVRGLGSKEVLSAPRSPWQNPYTERLIGSIRRECLDHLLVFNERQLRRILREYIAYNEVRPHHSLEMNAPVAREVEPQAKGKVISAVSWRIASSLFARSIRVIGSNAPKQFIALGGAVACFEDLGREAGWQANARCREL